MEISDIRVKLIQDSGDRLKAVCSITLDDEFVVRDLKVVEGTNGLFVAMPSRKLSVHCPQCRGKNHLRARFCNECGAKLPPARPTGDAAGRPRMHRDIAHPINPTFREIVQNRVIEKYRQESELAKSPDYTPVDIDHDESDQSDDSSSGYAPSEYDQLIAGLNKGSQEPARERETRPTPPPPPAPRPQRQPDRRRNDYNDRGPRQQRAPQQQRGPANSRGDIRRGDQNRQGRGQSSGPRQPAPVRFEIGPDDEVNGNVAIPGERPQYTRRVPQQPRRAEEPRRAPEPQRMAEPQLDQFDEPTPTPRRPEPRRVENPPPRQAEAPPAARPAPPPPQPRNDDVGSDDLPFGAGL